MGGEEVFAGDYTPAHQPTDAEDEYEIKGK